MKGSIDLCYGRLEYSGGVGKFIFYSFVGLLEVGFWVYSHWLCSFFGEGGVRGARGLVMRRLGGNGRSTCGCVCSCRCILLYRMTGRCLGSGFLSRAVIKSMVFRL